MKLRPQSWLLVALVGAGVLLPALPGLLSGGATVPGDAPEIPLPGLVAAGRAVAAGQLPVWTDALYLGAPLPSAGDVGLRYPPNLLFALLGAGWAYNLLLAAHLLFAAAGTAALARAHGASRTAAALAALAFGGGGFVMGHTENLVRIEAIAWTPWMFLGAEQLVGSPSRRGLVLLGLSGGAALLTGYAPFAVYALGWVVLYGLFRGRQEGKLGPVAASGALALGLAGLVAAAQLLPMAAMLPLAAHGHAPEPGFAVDNSLHPAQLLDLLAPLAWRGTGWDVQAVGYLGLLPLGLAWLARHRAVGRLLLGLSAASLVLSLGENIPGYRILTTLLPPLELLGRPYRLFIGGAVLLPVAAALGWDRAGRAGKIALLALPLAALVVRLGGGVPTLLLATAAGLGACLAVLRQRARLALALLVVELCTTQAHHLGLAGPSPLAPRSLAQPESAAWLQAQLGPGERYLGLREPDFDSPEQLWMQSPMRWDLASVQDGATSLVPWWFSEALGGAVPPGAGALALVRARYLLTAREGVFPERPVRGRFGEVLVRELGPVAPRTFLAGRWRAAPRDEVVAALRAAPELATLTAEILLEQEPDLPAAEGPCGTQQLISAEPGRLEVELALERPCLLVVTDSWHPDWSATFDGEAAPVLRAWGVIQAVPLPAGSGRLQLTVRPWDQWLGLGGSLLGLLLCAGIGLSAARRRAASPPVG
jgi:hypothetical protein